MGITETAVRDVLRQGIDPELGINVVDVRLVYCVEIDENGGFRSRRASRTATFSIVTGTVHQLN